MCSSWHVNASPLPSCLVIMAVLKWVNISESFPCFFLKSQMLCPHAPNSQVSSSNSSSLQCDQIWAKSHRHQSFWVPHTNPTLFLPSRGKRNWIVPSCPDHSVLGVGWSTHGHVSEHFGLQVSWLSVPLAASDSWLVARATKACQLSVYLMFLWAFKHLGLPGSPPCQWHCNEVWQIPFENYFILRRFVICFAFCFSLCMWWTPLGTFDIWKVIIIALINWITYVHMYSCAYLCAMEHLWMSQDSMEDEFSSSPMWDWT